MRRAGQTVVATRPRAAVDDPSRLMIIRQGTDALSHEIRCGEVEQRGLSPGNHGVNITITLRGSLIATPPSMAMPARRNR